MHSGEYLYPKKGDEVHVHYTGSRWQPGHKKCMRSIEAHLLRYSSPFSNSGFCIFSKNSGRIMSHMQRKPRKGPASPRVGRWRAARSSIQAGTVRATSASRSGRDRSAAIRAELEWSVFPWYVFSVIYHQFSLSIFTFDF